MLKKELLQRIETLGKKMEKDYKNINEVNEKDWKDYSNYLNMYYSLKN